MRLKTLVGLPGERELGQLIQILERTNGRLAILIAQIDPDGIGTALVLSRIAANFGVRPTIYYAASSGHPESTNMWEHFRLEMAMRPFPEDCALSMPAALVDSCSLSQDARFGEEVVIDPCIIIDHHEGTSKFSQDRFWLIDRNVGAASTLGMFVALELGVDVGSTAATCAALGIYTDTNRLTRNVSVLDRDMFVTAIRLADSASFHKVLRYSLSPRQTSLLSQISNNRVEVFDSVLLAHPDEYLQSGEGEILAIAAESCCQEGFELVMVWGVESDRLRVSVRANDPGIPLTIIMSQLFNGHAGAKNFAAGARIGLRDAADYLEFDPGFLNSHNDRAIISMLGTRLRDKVDYVLRNTPPGAPRRRG